MGTTHEMTATGFNRSAPTSLVAVRNPHRKEPSEKCVWFFFFSSRRRHTRCYRDWSSDVCSSDLIIRHTRCYRDWSSDVCSSDLMIRHTRCYRDWSSDVCSSDLGG